MVGRRASHWLSTRELAGRFTLVALGFTGCAPFVVEAFEPAGEEPVGSAPVSCPPGSAKAEPGSCGCDVPDEDFDGDGTPDCIDACPDNAGGIAPTGPCGCSSYGDLAACDELRAALRHLYTFDGQGTAVLDTWGDAPGTLQHVSADPLGLENLQRQGRLTLDGQGSYVDLPDGIISSLTDATFEAWLSWRGGDSWARIFDFGDNGGAPVNGVSYLFLTPSSVGAGPVRVAYSVAGPLEETVADGQAALPVHADPEDNPPDHVAVVIDPGNTSLRLYTNGLEVAARSQRVELGALNDVNNWLGRSNYLVDPPLSAVLVEVRIYSRALTAAQLAASFGAGPGALDGPTR